MQWSAAPVLRLRQLLRKTGTANSVRVPTPSAVSSLHTRYPYDMSRVLLLRIAGVHLGTSGKPLWSTGKLVRYFAVSAAPLLVGALYQLMDPPTGPLMLSQFGWLAYFFGLNVVSLAFSWTGCRMFYGLTESISEALTVEGKIEYDKWADRYTRRNRQLSGMVVFGIVSVFALWLAARSPGIGERLYVTPFSYAAIAWSGFLVGNCGYWLAHGTELAYRLSRPGRMKLIWSAPARTPGLETLARLYRYSFYLAAVGSAACITPILYWAYRGPAASELVVVKVLALVFTSAITGAIAILPQFWLSGEVGRVRSRSLRELTVQLPADCAGIPDFGDRGLGGVVNMIKCVSESPATTISDRTLASLLLGFATAAVPYLVQFAR